MPTNYLPILNIDINLNNSLHCEIYIICLKKVWRRGNIRSLAVKKKGLPNDNCSHKKTYFLSLYQYVLYIHSYFTYESSLLLKSSAIHKPETAEKTLSPPFLLFTYRQFHHFLPFFHARVN